MDASERSFSPAPGVLAQRVGVELVLVHPETNQIYALNATGASLWELLADGATSKALVDGLGERFDGDTQEIETEVARLLEELERHGLLAGG